MRPRLQCGKMLSPASKSPRMGGFFLVFKENTNGESLTVIPEDVPALELRIYKFLLLVKYLRKSYILHIYLTLMCDL